MVGAAPMTTQATLKLRATAGYKRKICDIHPMMVCNPSEPVGNLNTAYPFTPIIGQQILLKASGNGYWGPGDFGPSVLATPVGRASWAVGVRAFSRGRVSSCWSVWLSFMAIRRNIA